MERRYPDSRNVVVEIDPEVVHIARSYFDAPEGLDIVIADARNYVSAVRGSEEFDLLILDAFNSFSVPYHLATLEFIEAAALLLAPEGLFMANCIDILSLGGFMTAYLNTVERVFPHVRVYQTVNTTRDARSTFVIAAAWNPIDHKLLKDSRGRLVAKQVPPPMIQDLKRRNGDGVLTDDYAPVESLIAPVFLRSVD
jgi:spermidine synthase